MCGRFVQVINIEAIEQQFAIKNGSSLQAEENYNVSPGDYAYVISSDRPDELVRYQFGLTPNWAKKPMYLFNARAEGDQNKDNDPSYSGETGIIHKPSFRKPIRSQRCLVLANAYIEGPEKEKLNFPFAISMKSNDLFALAGIWDTWTDRNTGEIVHSFAIITTVANEITERIGHLRSPVIIKKGDEKNGLIPISICRRWWSYYSLIPERSKKQSPSRSGLKIQRINVRTCSYPLAKPLPPTLHP